MELRLAKFITAVEEITDIHNQDFSNPVLLNFQHPEFSYLDDTQEDDGSLKFQSFRMASSAEEPAHVNLPINGIWINMKPNSMYFRQALKLKSVQPPEISGVPSAITDDGFAFSWVLCSRYSQLFDESQDYGNGTKGPDGEPGRKNILHVGNYVEGRTYRRGEGCMYKGGFCVSTANYNMAAPDSDGAPWQVLSIPGNLPDVDYDYIIERVVRILYPTPQ